MPTFLPPQNGYPPNYLIPKLQSRQSLTRFPGGHKSYVEGTTPVPMQQVPTPSSSLCAKRKLHRAPGDRGRGASAFPLAHRMGMPALPWWRKLPGKGVQSGTCHHQPPPPSLSFARRAAETAAGKAGCRAFPHSHRPAHR